MEVTTSDLAEASRLIGWAARPRERPARHEDYAKLVARYDDDPNFAVVCDAVAAGAGLTLQVDRHAGVVAVAESDSPWRMPTSDLMRRAGSDKRALIGVILCAVAKVAFPQQAHLDDPDRVARVSVGAVVDQLGRIVDRLDEETADIDADDPDLAPLWRTWTYLRRGRSGAQRASFGDQDGAVKKLCKFLEGEGHLQWISGDDGGTWRATPRLRAAVRALVEDSDIYGAVIGSASVDGGEAAS